MEKDRLKRLKAILLASTIFLTLSACKKNNNNENKTESSNETTIFFLQGKALIYEEGINVLFNEYYTAITNSTFRDFNITTFSQGVEAIQVKSMGDAIELATLLVGEENIIYIDYKDEDMQLTRERN